MTSLTTGDDRIVLSYQTDGSLSDEEKKVILRVPSGLPLFALPDDDKKAELWDPVRICENLQRGQLNNLSNIQFLGIGTETNRLNSDKVYPVGVISIHIRGRTDMPNYIHCDSSSMAAGLFLSTIFYQDGTDYKWVVCASNDPQGEIKKVSTKRYWICPMGRVLRTARRGKMNIRDSSPSDLPTNKALVSAYISA